MLHLLSLLLLACAPETGEAELVGFVRTPDGAPVVGAAIWAQAPPTRSSGEATTPVTTVTGPDGGYTLHLPADGLQTYSVSVTVGGHDEPAARLTVHAGQHLTKHFAVRSTRVVDLRCLGFAEESCQEIAGVRCWVPDGGKAPTRQAPASVEGGHRSIECPAGADLVVEVAGQEVKLSASEDIARFDFTGLGGAVTGSIASDARSCLVSARRPFLGSFLGAWPDDTRYVRTPRGEPFRVDHLPAGTWVIKGTCVPAQTADITVEVGDTTVDLGVLALAGAEANE
ncbi:MAG: carboxypeptidase-like regulatory domain-containing protein [Myxococcota bacterium]